MVLSMVGGMAFDQLGDGMAMQILVNVVSFGALFAVAYGVAWIKSTPWKRQPAPALAAISPAAPRSPVEPAGTPLPPLRKAAS